MPEIFGAAAVGLLAEYGVRDVFGIPGVHTIELYRGLSDAGIVSHPARHEQGVGFMADAYARMTGKPGVALLVTGPGVLNALTPYAQAWHDSIPLLYISATTQSDLLGSDRGPLHDIHDQVGVLAGISPHSYLVREPEDFPRILAQAWQAMTVGRPRPAHIAIPIDILERRVAGAFEKVELPTPDAPLVRNDIVGAAGLLSTATNPVILAGGGARYAAQLVQEFAERIDAPVVNTGNASGVLDADHPLSVGTLLPFQGARDLVSQADVVVALGTEFSETDVLYTGKPLSILGSLIRVDIDPRQLEKSHPAAFPLQGDVGQVLKEVLAELPLEMALRGGAERTKTARKQCEWTAQSRGHFPWLDSVIAAMTQNQVTVLDSTQLAYTAHHYVPQKSGQTWVATYGLGTLGAALPMAIGARIAGPGRPVLAIAGDGGALFTLTELATAVDLGQQITFLIWDNKGYGEIRDSFDRAAAPRVDTEITARDLVSIAQGFGAKAHRVATPSALVSSLQESYRNDGVTVLLVSE